MCELQAIIEFSVELNKFINIDLFQRGYYQIRVSHKVNTKLINKIEVNFSEIKGLTPPTPKVANGSNDLSNSIVFPQCIVNGSAVSKTFQVMYKNEEIFLNDVITFKTHLIVDASQCIEQIRKTTFILDVELWFSDQNFGPHQHNTIECVSMRQLIMHFDICRGLHYHLPVIFDYFHLAAITVSIHGSLTTLCQPYITRSKPKPNNGKDGISSSASLNQIFGYDMLLFGCSLSSLTSDSTKNSEEIIALRLRRAQLVHWQLCSILLTAIQSLNRKIKEYIHMLPPWTQAKCQKLNISISTEGLSPLARRCYKDCLDISEKSGSFSFISYQNQSMRTHWDTASSFTNMKPDEVVATVESDMSYLCGSAVIAWQQLLKVVLHNDKISQHLAKVHHLQRIKRFSEAFFVIEKQKQSIYSICDTASALYSEISDCLRRSSYLSKLPHCDVECSSVDGDPSTLPIIYEEKYDQDSPYHDRPTASLSDIRLEDNFTCLFRKSNSECIYPQKKNLKEKLFTNLTRLNLGYGKLREEFSPRDNRYGSLDSAQDARKSSSSSKICSNDSKNVTLLKFRKLGEFNSNSLYTKSKIKETHSLYILKQTHSRSMSTSESLPDLSGTCSNTSRVEEAISPTSPVSSISEITSSKIDCILNKKSIKPPLKFRDEKPKLAINTEFQGTVYFPKPPPQFSVEETSSEDDDDLTPVAEPNSEDATPTDTRPSSKTNASGQKSSSRHISTKKVPSIKEEKCTILDMFKYDQCLICGEGSCSCETKDEEVSGALKRASAITYDLVCFVKAKEDFREQIAGKFKNWNLYSDFPSLASRIPYFQCDADLRAFSPDGLHLVICVHGLDGNSADLRLVKTYLELGLPTTNFEFLMSQRNQGETFDSFEILTSRLVQEITYHIELYGLTPSKISFIGHSLGNVIIRAALARPEMKQWIPKLNTFLSLSGPHLGTAYNQSGLVNMGLWFMQKWKKSESLLQLAMKDASDPRKSFLYKLSLEPGLEYFRHVLLCGSSQDHYVPIHSAHIELCNSALNDTSLNGIAYREMVTNLLRPLVSQAHTKLIRYDVHHSLSSSANSLIGRAAHIAVLDSELFIEKFMVVVGLKYFA